VTADGGVGGCRQNEPMQVLRVCVAVGGVVVVVVNGGSVLRALVMPRGRYKGLPRVVDRFTSALFRSLSGRKRSYEQRDRVLAVQAPAYLVMVLAGWLMAFLVGFAAILWPFTRDGFGALRESGSSLLTLGFAATPQLGPTIIDLCAAAAGLATVALQIGYLPTIYGAFNRRETEVTLLGVRAGVPPWGPEMLARTRVGLQAEGDIDDVYKSWERWAADVAESHSNYPVLIRFRSPQAHASWLVAMIAVLDSAALFHACSPSRAPMSGRLVLRMGWTCLRQIADVVGVPYDPDPRPDAPLQLTFQEFAQGVAWMRAVGFEVERSDEQAWAHFCGWRVNYESIAYALCKQVDAVPAMWAGGRRHNDEPIAPFRPPIRSPEDPEGAIPMTGDPDLPTHHAAWTDQPYQDPPPPS